MKTLKTLASALILSLVAIGAAEASDRPAGGNGDGGGGDIIVFDIVDSVTQETASQSASRPAGGNGDGGGGDIIVWDIVD